MDRNLNLLKRFFTRKVALRKESVDRNRFFWYCLGTRVSSLSARRAWIEIMALDQYLNEQEVALRKESVDRNKCSFGNPCKKPWSLSARRAWIEI